MGYFIVKQVRSTEGAVSILRSSTCSERFEKRSSVSKLYIQNTRIIFDAMRQQIFEMVACLACCLGRMKMQTQLEGEAVCQESMPFLTPTDTVHSSLERISTASLLKRLRHFGTSWIVKRVKTGHSCPRRTLTEPAPPASFAVSKI